MSLLRSSDFYLKHFSTKHIFEGLLRWVTFLVWFTLHKYTYTNGKKIILYFCQDSLRYSSRMHDIIDS